MATQANSWDAFPIVGTPPAAPSVRPGRPNLPPPQHPAEAIHDDLSNEETRLRIQRMQHPEPPAGFRYTGDGNLEFIPGGPADPSNRGRSTRQLPQTAIDHLGSGASGVINLQRAITGFQDDFAGNALTGGIENSIQNRVSSFGTPGQSQWWSDIASTDNVLRNALFGASLTSGEKQAWEATTVTPSMDPALVRTNLTRRLQIAQAALRRQARTYRANGFNEDAIRESLGELAPLIADQPGAPARDQAQTPGAAGLPPAGAPPTIGGSPSPSGGEQPQVHSGGPSGVEGVSSDAPPVREVTPQQRALAQRVQSMFDQGASADQINEFVRARGVLPFEGPALAAAIQYRDRGGRGARILPNDQMTPAGTRAAAMDQQNGPQGAGDLLIHGAAMGLTDEAAGIGGAAYNILSSPFTGDFDPVGAYQVNRDADRIRLTEARDRLGWGGTALEVGGSLLGGNPAALAESAGPALGSRVLSGARAGSEIGALSGYGNGNGLGGSIRGAVADGIVGGAGGAAAPLVGAGVNAMRGVTRTVMGRNPDLAQRAISEAIAGDSNTPRIVGQQMQEAQANGVPYMLADSGDNVRGLLAASARAPGPGRTVARDALEQRQAGLGERVAGAVERDLGPASNPHEVNDALMERARAQAAPLYEAAYARPGASGFANDVSGLLRRPAMRQAMARARMIAEEEGRDPTALGFDIDAAGDVSLTRAPSWQTMDYVKRGLDDILQAQPRDPATGRLILDEGTRAIQGTLRGFVSRFDQANPDYAAARAAWAGPVRAKDAMDIGRRALNLNADDLAARTRDLSPNEMEFVRLGVRRAMVEAVAGKGDTANVVNTVIGTPKRRAMLARLFGGREEFERFVSTLQAEREGHRTFQRAAQGSPTAANVQDDAHLSGTVATAMTDVATTGLPIGTIVKHAIQFGTSRAGREAQQQIATLLSETDPARLIELSRELRKQAYRARAQGRASGRRAVITGSLGGSAAGRSSGD